jgi:hypothetical protein
VRRLAALEVGYPEIYRIISFHNDFLSKDYQEHSRVAPQFAQLESGSKKTGYHPLPIQSRWKAALT